MPQIYTKRLTQLAETWLRLPGWESTGQVPNTPVVVVERLIQNKENNGIQRRFAS